MKPSERINQIEYEVCGGSVPTASVVLWSIKKFLDEEWEKQQKVRSDAIREAAKRAAGLQ